MGLHGIRVTKFTPYTEAHEVPLVVRDPGVPRYLLSGSCPQLLDVTLRTIQVPVNKERVGVGADLRRDPGSQPNERGGQSLAQAKDPLEARDGDLYMLPHCAPPLGWLGGQEDANLGQGLPQLLASVGEISQEPPRHPPPPKPPRRRVLRSGRHPRRWQEE